MDFIRELEKSFPLPDVLPEKLSGGYLFSNDPSKINDLSYLRENYNKSTSQSTVSLIVGNGCILTFLPYLSSKYIVMIDRDPIVLALMKNIVSAVIDIEDEKNFIDCLYDKVQKDNLPITKAILQSGFEREKNKFKQECFLNKLKQVKNHLTKKSFGFICLDIFNYKNIQTLKEHLSKHKKKYSLFKYY